MQRQCATRACANFYNSLHILHISNCFPFFVHTRLKLKSLLLASRIAKAIRISATTTPTPLLQPTLTRMPSHSAKAAFGSGGWDFSGKGIAHRTTPTKLGHMTAASPA